MEEVAAFGLLCFVSLFAVVEPLGLIPIFIGMTGSRAPAAQRNVARRACIVAFMTLFIFALTGQLIFRFFGISVDSMKVVGGIIFFLIGYEMLQARHSKTAVDDGHGHVTDPDSDVALTPLGIPMIAGPGAITSVIVRWNEADTMAKQVAVLVAIVAVMIVTLVLLLSARRVARFLGESGNRVLLRLMGLITMVIAVELFFGGLTPIVQKMWKPA
ncbi:MAG TPA: NAAT family transporter [Gemmataceae bacterium]|jgi:multiple antibiotic resistance protein|nr:NAAT family transporter [Gemmataceae bacterium]